MSFEYRFRSRSRSPAGSGGTRAGRPSATCPRWPSCADCLERLSHRNLVRLQSFPVARNKDRPAFLVPAKSDSGRLASRHQRTARWRSEVRRRVEAGQFPLFQCHTVEVGCARLVGRRLAPASSSRTAIVSTRQRLRRGEAGSAEVIMNEVLDQAEVHRPLRLAWSRVSRCALSAALLVEEPHCIPCA